MHPGSGAIGRLTRALHLRFFRYISPRAGMSGIELMFAWFGVHGAGPTHKGTGRERETTPNRRHVLDITVGPLFRSFWPGGPALLDGKRLGREDRRASAGRTAVPRPGGPPCLGRE